MWLPGRPRWCRLVIGSYRCTWEVFTNALSASTNCNAKIVRRGGNSLPFRRHVDVEVDIMAEDAAGHVKAGQTLGRAIPRCVVLLGALAQYLENSVVTESGMVRNEGRPWGRLVDVVVTSALQSVGWD